MLELVAQGPAPVQRWRQELRPGGPYSLGRAAETDFPVPWDARISRCHLLLTVEGERIHIETPDGVVNAAHVAGEPRRSFDLRDGGRFAIGETVFDVRRLASKSFDRTPVARGTFDGESLRSVKFEDADRRIEVLTRLPEVILGAASPAELHGHLVDLILSGVARADAAAVVMGNVTGNGAGAVGILHRDRRRPLEGELRPSGRLVSETLGSGRSVLHVWDAWDASPGDGPFTVAAEFDWAFCTPLSLPGSAPTGLYVAGRFDASGLVRPGVEGSARAALQSDVKFAELVAAILRSVLRLNDLERQTAGLRQFLAPPILAALGGNFDLKLLEPRECDATVLFCDLRGFVATAEGASGDLLGLLERVSHALGTMTNAILAHGGVTGDFLGDAALGFWGWPFASQEAPLDACRAALAIRREFSRTAESPDHPLRGFRVGIGIAHGPAVAGKIGTPEQVKFTVFGPVVNLASRLEGMTKQFRVPILIDEPTAEVVRSRMPDSEGRTRKLAKILPYGSDRPLVVSELLPPASESGELTAEHLAVYESAVDAFTVGRWDEAYRLLHRMPPEDTAPDFLSQMITTHNRVPPSGWDGIVRLATK